MKTLREHKEEEAATQQQLENEATFTAWIQKHPQIRDCIATRQAFEEFMEGEDIWTEADLDYALATRVVRDLKTVPGIVDAHSLRCVDSKAHVVVGEIVSNRTRYERRGRRSAIAAAPLFPQSPQR